VYLYGEKKIRMDGHFRFAFSHFHRLFKNWKNISNYLSHQNRTEQQQKQKQKNEKTRQC
jgi:hypothetical protein